MFQGSDVFNTPRKCVKSSDTFCDRDQNGPVCFIQSITTAVNGHLWSFHQCILRKCIWAIKAISFWSTKWTWLRSLTGKIMILYLLVCLLATKKRISMKLRGCVRNYARNIRSVPDYPLDKGFFSVLIVCVWTGGVRAGWYMNGFS